jgi:hypothetical protein
MVDIYSAFVIRLAPARALGIKDMVFQVIERINVMAALLLNHRRTCTM